MNDLTSDEKQQLRQEIFRTRPSDVCDDCGGYHLRKCPRIKRQVWVGAGASAGFRTEVEYFDKWDDSMVTWPEDIWDEEEGS